MRNIQTSSGIDYNPADGINYYPLKQMDYDGAYEFFGPLAEKYTFNMQKQTIHVVRAPHSVYIILPRIEPGTMDLFDMQGRLIVSKIASGKLEINEPKGTYIMRFRNDKESTSA